jgi:hypothetical protein
MAIGNISIGGTGGASATGSTFIDSKISNISHDVYDNNEWAAKQYIIQGKMLHVKQIVDVNTMSKKGGLPNTDVLKRQLAISLAEQMIENKLIEFTYMDNQLGFERIYHARCFLVPNDDVQLLRMMSDGTWK